ncbi:MAG TPA: gamma-glutamyl-gamma-aminobutyrate hydrolase family protein [Methanothrix sp.]|nr:gamma-glutamyl-gamma-aminobutyrate hydrolase family protein [Methanothrix sp.]HPT19811.1 gamma-glutamyl-gamma-aminobutyrate hydrolase family protein [Methanothrix sp.]
MTAVEAKGDILLLDLASQQAHLSRYELVRPIGSILQKAGHACHVIHYSDLRPEDLQECGGVILCGTALMDNGYAENLSAFSWLKDFCRPVLGICAGMQVISAAFGGSIVSHPSIGLEKIDIIQASPLLGGPRAIEGYMLHNFAASLPEDFMLLAGRAEAAQAFRHTVRPIYGIIFHPEVRNRWILESFAAGLAHNRQGSSYETDLCNESSQ